MCVGLFEMTDTPASYSLISDLSERQTVIIRSESQQSLSL